MSQVPALPTILLVEDDDNFTSYLVTTLEASGFKVLHARNGKEALRHYEPDSIQLVLTDLIMEDMDGIELIMELRKLSPKVKIVAMSGGGKLKIGGHLPVAKHLGASSVLSKPFTIQNLLDAIHSALGHLPLK